VDPSPWSEAVVEVRLESEIAIRVIANDDHGSQDCDTSYKIVRLYDLCQRPLIT